MTPEEMMAAQAAQQQQQPEQFTADSAAMQTPKQVKDQVQLRMQAQQVEQQNQANQQAGQALQQKEHDLGMKEQGMNETLSALAAGGGRGFGMGNQMPNQLAPDESFGLRGNIRDEQKAELLDAMMTNPQQAGQIANAAVGQGLDRGEVGQVFEDFSAYMNQQQG